MMPNTPVTPKVSDVVPESIAVQRNALPPLDHRGCHFVFVACQRGAESYLKAKWTGAEMPFRLAFSRPGLLTFKLPAEVIAEIQPPSGVIVRQSGFAFGQLRGNDASLLAKEAIDLAGPNWSAVHVFARDEQLPGSRGFEPLATPLVKAVAGEFAKLLPAVVDCSGESAQLGAEILDIILIEPHQWLVGFHRADRSYQRWPGGVFPIVPPTTMVSRAYLKMAEAIAWSQLPLQAGDRIVEIGSSPGGACQRLLDLGLMVTGIDAAEMDPLILQHPRFEHWRGKSNSIKRRRFSKFRWLAADANVAPQYTLDAVEDLVQYPTSHFKGLLMTLKLSAYELLDRMPEYLQRIRSWGFERVEARQLSFNRRECCVVAER